MHHTEELAAFAIKFCSKLVLTKLIIWNQTGHNVMLTETEHIVLTETGTKQGTILFIYIQIIHLMEEEEVDYWMVESVLFEGKKTCSLPSETSYADNKLSYEPLSYILH